MSSYKRLHTPPVTTRMKGEALPAVLNCFEFESGQSYNERASTLALK